MRVVLDYPPTANLYWRHARGRTYVSADALAYRRKAAFDAVRGGVVLTQGPVCLLLDVYRPRRIGDLDNTLKVLIDALRGIAYDDDKQVVEIHARRFEDKEKPRVEVTILEAKEVNLERQKEPRTRQRSGSAANQKD